jgi:hypothetical protein
MSKLKNTRGFTDLFTGILNLSEKQIAEIDQLEYEKYKAYFWNSDSSELMKFGIIKSILKLLTPVQMQLLRTYKSEKIRENELRETHKLQESYDRESKRLIDLNLSEDQLWRFVITKQKLHKLTKEKMIEAVKTGIFDHQNITKEIEVEYLKPIFSNEQYLQYSKIIKEEDQKKLEWLQKMTKERFEHDYKTKITDDQAILIYNIEENAEERDADGEFYSNFEQEEIKLEKYREILDKRQFRKYYKQYEGKIMLIQQDLINTNDNFMIQLERRRKEYHYYQKNILPFKVEVRNQLEVELTLSQKQILDELRKLYFSKLIEEKSKFLAQHQRYNRYYVSNEWEDYLIQYNFNTIRPNGYYLEGNNLITELMTDKLVQKIKLSQNQLKEKFKEFKMFQVDLYENSGGEYGGWLMKIPHKSEPSYLEYLSFLLLAPDLKSNLKRVKKIE